MTRPGGLFAERGLKSWLLIFAFFVYASLCWIVYSVTVEPIYGVDPPGGIAADSGSYFIRAGLADPSSPDTVVSAGLVSFGGSALGPVVIALIGRGFFGVALINCLLFLLIVWMAGTIPGVRREYFAVLMALEPQLLPTLMTLNKEILALTGLVSFAAYVYERQEKKGGPWKRRWLLVAGLLFSALARWEQILIPVWYLAIQSRRSPVRGKPGWATLLLLLVCSAGWSVSVNLLHLNLGGFIVAVTGAGTVAKLYAVQARGGYFLVAFPKILMNLAGRWVTPGYFLSDYWNEDFGGNLQNQYIGILSSLSMLFFVGYAIVRGRFRLGRPLIHLTLIYFICTSINPFIQHRYIYPGFVLLALELSRNKEELERVKPLPRFPSLAPSYRALQRTSLAGAAKHSA